VKRWEDNNTIELTEMGFIVWTGFIQLEMGPVAGSCEYCDELCGFIKGRQCFDYLNEPSTSD
jgi:hypothetical protein